jgi:5-methylcytosine-specific restriction endonuclease McrA
MAKNTQKRIPVKWIRDRAKGAYQKQSQCWVCGTNQDLELHHTHSITLLLERWCQLQGIQLDTDDEVLRVRDQFIEEHQRELYELVYTLCNRHHVRLHQIFGKAPGLGTASKQQSWLELQRQKQSGEVLKQPTWGSPFSEFTGG